MRPPKPKRKNNIRLSPVVPGKKKTGMSRINPKEVNAQLREASLEIQKANTELRNKDKRVERIAAKLNALLPEGFTPAVNMDILPPAIQDACRPPELPALEDISLSSVNFIPTPDQRQRVFDMSMWGVPQTDMCMRIINPLTKKPISARTLTTAFAEEIRLGRAECREVFARSIYMGAKGAPAEFDGEGNKIRDELKPNAAMAIFGSKVHLGWKDAKTVDITHNNSAADPELASIMKQLSPDELRFLRDLSRRRALEAPLDNNQDGRQTPERGET